MIRAIILDFNGVLADDEHVHFTLFRDVLAGLGVSLTEQAYQDEYLGYDDRGCFSVALERAGRFPTVAEVDELIAEKARRYAAWARESLTYFPFAAEMVRALEASWPVAICSGALRGEIDAALERLGVAEQVVAIVAAEDTDRCKPDPEGYLLALDALRSRGHEDLEAGHCLVVEDSLAGVQAAKAAGMWAIGVTHSYPAHALRHAGADAVVESLEPITPAWVARLFQPEISP
jgi:HAD superfamily hydrolase (TIGR01509 family)